MNAPTAQGELFTSHLYNLSAPIPRTGRATAEERTEPKSQPPTGTARPPRKPNN